MIIQNLPRFQPENMEKNALIFERVSQMAAGKGKDAHHRSSRWLWFTIREAMSAPYLEPQR